MLDWSNEEWAPIPIQGFAGYEVSSLGNVRSWKNARWGRAPFPQALKQSNKGKYGYKQVNLGNGSGGYESFEVQQLVALSFHGPKPSSVHQVAHGDGNPANNHKDNLRWATAKENASDKYLHGTVPRGESTHNSKLTEDDVREIRGLLGCIPQSQIAKRFNISESGVTYIKQGKIWGHVQ
ncbi:HNH endonuclease [Streptomyces sp. NBC_01241]|uniref:HNH endonuclease n=1 Tax=Streptomyces sp. NBC_01241 TaxID=2903794 RepID=UPI00352C51F3|nr:HNH endonuclease [Streptomyces sp. NBC_01241]